MGEHLPAGVEPDEDMLVIRDIAGVIGLVQRGVIEFHTWGAKALVRISRGQAEAIRS